MHCFPIALENPSILCWSKLLIARAAIIPLTTNKYGGGGGEMLLINGSSNISAVIPPPFTTPWTSITVLSLVIFLIAVCCNAFVLFIFARNTALRTPFTTYIINLLIANLLSQLFQQPLSIAAQLYTWPHLGQGFCRAYQYGSYAIHAAVFNSHFLITLNRIWAVVSPTSYRQYHTRTLARFACVLLWVYVHTVMLPGLVMNAVYYEIPLEEGCYVALEPLRAWYIAHQLLLYETPLSCQIVAYPVICLSRVRRRLHRNRLNPQNLTR